MTSDDFDTNIRTAAFGNKHRPKQTLLDALNYADKMKCCVVIYVDDDDYVQTSWSDGSLLKRMGMTQLASIRMLDAAKMDEEQD